MSTPWTRPLTTTTVGASGSASNRRMTCTPWSGAMGVMPSRVSASTTDSRSPMPTPDQTDHSRQRARQRGYRSATSRVRSASHSFAVA